MLTEIQGNLLKMRLRQLAEKIDDGITWNEYLDRMAESVDVLTEKSPAPTQEPIQ